MAKTLVAVVPAPQATAGWLLDQIALRDDGAQQLRAILVPDFGDLRGDREAVCRAHQPACSGDARR
ncbi:hypothetical protein ABZZ44_18010 [Streptomyces sp. NPDC006460]|uniref:hypothetical protein n=1 Tax=Streptomyces sp. NPDC006460 TaxID=3154304 RepID=UPI0033BC56A3